MKCPACSSRQVVPGRLPCQDGDPESFMPNGLRLLTWSKTVPLVSDRAHSATQAAFCACTQCGLVWSRVPANALCKLIDESGTDALREKLALTAQAERKLGSQAVPPN